MLMAEPSLLRGFGFIGDKAGRGREMAHDPQAAEVIEAAIGAEIVPAGEFRMRVLAATDEAVALAVLDALDRHGLEVVRRR